jgi:RND family efflux transporter, MFP subunit
MKTYRLIGALLFAIALTACGNKQNAASGDHPHDENLQLTAYSEAFEVYAEATPFVVGQEGTILAHFSFLKNFKPITEGKITVSLIVGTDGVRQTLNEPTRVGIYLFNVKPATAGSGKIVFDIETPEGKSQIIVPNIKVYTDIHDAQHDAADAVATSSNGVLFTKEASWKLDFATEEARLEPFGQVIRATAQILPAQGDQRVVAAKAGGIIIFSGQEIVEGKTVGAGQSLFSIESDGMADNNLSVRLSEATAEYNRAKTEYERKKELAKDNIVSQSELLKAQTEYTNAEAVYNNLRKNFSLGRQVISSPIGGYITQVLVRNGQYVEPGQPVVVVSQNKDLLVKAELQPRYYPLLSDITSANFVITNSNLKYTLEELSGKVVSFGKSSDLENPLVPVIFQVKNSVGLLSGSFIEMYIKTQSNTQAITIPNDAILEEMGNYFIYTQLTPEFFEKRAIRKGVTDGLRTEIIEGVSVGDRVVSKGAILVKLAQASGALDAHSGHVH